MTSRAFETVVRSFLLGLVLAAAGAVVAAAAETGAAAATQGDQTADVAAMKATIESIRNVGTALYTWAQDQPKAEGSGPAFGEEAVDWSQCPAISHADAAALLAPKYIAELPENDGWGRPLELCLRRPFLAKGDYMMGVRSAGRDGVFQGTSYAVGAFDPRELDRDTVWIDGYFMTWPQKK